MRLIYHPDAEMELMEAAQVYESGVPGLGERFLTEMDEAIRGIEEAPHRWPILEDEIRRRTLLRFPYSIYYRVEGSELRILVIKHHSRHPDYWRDRITGAGAD